MALVAYAKQRCNVGVAGVGIVELFVNDEYDPSSPVVRQHPGLFAFLDVGSTVSDKFNITTSSLTRWLDALDGARNATRGPARILWIGDSVAEGFSVDVPATSFRFTRPSVILINALNGTLVPYGKAFDGIMGINLGVGPSVYDALWVPGASAAAFPYGNSSWGATGLYDLNQTGGASVSHYGPFTCEGFKTYWVSSSSSSASAIKLGVDSGTLGSALSLSAGVAIGPIVTHSVSVASGSHTLDLAPQTGPCVLVAVEPTRTNATGLISVGSAGIGATGVGNWTDNTNPNASPLACITAAAADLVIIGLGGNDQNGGTSAASFDTALRSIVTTAQAAGGDVITLAQPPNTFANEATLRYQYRDVFRDIATDTDSGHIDLGSRWHDDWTASDIAGFICTDGIHPSKHGYADIARAVADALISVD